MHARFLAIGFLALLCDPACSRPPSERELYEQLSNGKGATKALQTVLEKPDGCSPLILYPAAALALHEKRLEDSGFLFYAAQMRVRFDKECFPPKGQGGNDPLLVYGALSEEIGSEVNPAVMEDPKVLEKVLARLKKWTPRASGAYDPGYEFVNRKAEKDALEATKPSRTEFIEGMSGFCTLLKDPEYFAAMKVIQAYNFSPRDKRPPKEVFDKAQETMKRIENEKGIKGISRT
jgi:hypothetical protein